MLRFSLARSYAPNPVLVIIDVQPKELGIPTKAYYAVEEVREVSKTMAALISLLVQIFRNHCHWVQKVIEIFKACPKILWLILGFLTYLLLLAS